MNRGDINGGSKKGHFRNSPFQRETLDKSPFLSEIS
jgi:hypothetical protein